MNVPKPWTPIRVNEDENGIRISVLGREYDFGHNIFPEKILVDGENLLSSPIRAVGLEHHEPISWHIFTNWVSAQSDESVEICACAESRLLILNAVITIGYDGYVHYSLRLSPRGFHIRTGFDVKPDLTHREANRLWLEIPLKDSMSALCHFGGSGTKIYGGNYYENAHDFRPLSWYGTDECGLALYADSDKTWQAEDRNKAVEMLKEEQTHLIRWHFLDSSPRSWDEQEKARNAGRTTEQLSDMERCGLHNVPVSFDFSLQATPVKPFDSSILKERMVHIDCFKKIEEDEYLDFLMNPSGNGECVMDRLQKSGITTLILHEKWNHIEGYWEVAPKRAKNVQQIIDQAHARGIKVVLYFTNTISSLRRETPEYMLRNCYCDDAGIPFVTHYRQPPQRTVRTCANGPEVMNDFVSGILGCVDRFGADGVYIDSAQVPWRCTNELHGCGYHDENGVLHGTYPVENQRKAYQRLYVELHEKRGKAIQFHPFNAFFPSVLAYADLYWYGEQIAFSCHSEEEIVQKLRLDCIRAEYTGRNIGVFCQFLAYELPDNSWNFDKALAVMAPHGVFPRPNDVQKPLDVMVPVWNALNAFEAEKACFRGYWTDSVQSVCDTDGLLLSEYVLPGKRLLIFGNPSTKSFENVQISLKSGHFVRDMLHDRALEGNSMSLNVAPFEYEIWLVSEEQA